MFSDSGNRYSTAGSSVFHQQRFVKETAEGHGTIGMLIWRSRNHGHLPDCSWILRQQLCRCGFKHQPPDGTDIVNCTLLFNVHVTLHRDKFRIIKPTRCTNFSVLLLEWNSTCFGQFLCPSSGVFHCTHSTGIRHTGLRTACKAGSGWNILILACKLGTFRDNLSVPSSRVKKSIVVIPYRCIGTSYRPLALEDGTDRLSRNVDKELPLHPA